MRSVSFCRDCELFFSLFCRDEDVLSDLGVDYYDNAPCIELLTCQVSLKVANRVFARKVVVYL